MPTNDFELTVPDLYVILPNRIERREQSHYIDIYWPTAFMSKYPLGSGFESPLKIGNLANILDNFTPRGSTEQGYMFRQNKLLYCSANFKKGWASSNTHMSVWVHTLRLCFSFFCARKEKYGFISEPLTFEWKSQGFQDIRGDNLNSLSRIIVNFKWQITIINSKGWMIDVWLIQIISYQRLINNEYSILVQTSNWRANLRFTLTRITPFDELQISMSHTYLVPIQAFYCKYANCRVNSEKCFRCSDCAGMENCLR